jgi:hypothetical protein
LTIDRFGGDEDDKFLEILRGRDDVAINTYLEEHTSEATGKLLVAGLLFISHETPYSHSISPATLELVKEYTTPSSLIGTIMSFWRDRPSTGTVLVMKYVDLDIISLGDVMAWLMEQDGWMRKSWGWEIIQVCVEKTEGRLSRQVQTSAMEEVEVTSGEANGGTSTEAAEQPTEESMLADSKNGEINGHDMDEKKEMFEKVIGGIGACFERQTDADKDWLKEWFGMVVRRYSGDIAGPAAGWVGDEITVGEEYRSRYA